MQVIQQQKPRLSIESKPLCILVADDHYANRLLTQSLLNRHGHDIVLASDGKEAVSCCRSIIFDLILLDIQMPVMNGIQAARQIMALENSNKDAQIFALTAHSHGKEIRTILASGFKAVLNKPFRVAELMRHLDRPYKDKMDMAAQIDDTEDTDPKIYNNVIEMPLLEVQTLDILIDAVATDRMASIIKAYWQDAATMMDSLKSTRIASRLEAQKDLIALRKTAHGLKGASANVGLLKASRLAAHLQNAPIDNIPYLIESIETTLADSKTALDQYCGIAS